MKFNDLNDLLHHFLHAFSSPADQDYQLEFVPVPIESTCRFETGSVFLTLLLGTESKFCRNPSDHSVKLLICRFKDTPFRIEQTGQGLRVYAVKGVSSAIVHDFFKVLLQGLRIADQILLSDIDSLVFDGRLIVPNHHFQLRDRFDYFRSTAMKSRQASDLSTDDESEGVPDRDKHPSNQFGEKNRLTDYLGLAMLDAYFEWLDHILVFLLPFMGYDPNYDNPIEFIRLPWKDKLGRIWNLTLDNEARKLYDSLLEIRERFLLSTDGIGCTHLMVSFPEYGNQLIRLARYTARIQYGAFSPLPASLDEVCALLDQVDSRLQERPGRYGFIMAESGCSVDFSPERCETYQLAGLLEPSDHEFLDQISPYSG